MKPLVSVIIDTYNYGQFVEQAIENVLNQDFPKEKIETIVIDDGSTDDTRERVTRRFPQVKYIYQQNRGQAGAFNTGLSIAKGEIICLLDADDYWLPEKIEIVVEKFEKNPKTGMVQHFMQTVDTNGKPIPTRCENRKEQYTLNDFLNGSTAFTGTSGLSFRRISLNNLLPIPEELFYCADEYLYNIIFYSPVYSINKALGIKKIHERNWFAGTISDVKRLERNVKVRRYSLRVLEGILRERGIDINKTKVYLPLNLLKEEVILYSATGRKSKATRVLLDYLRSHDVEPHLLFTYSSLVLGLFSSDLYFRLYDLYSTNSFLYATKRLLLGK